jgi:uncharacterized protein YndB with AHSA1/START domain
MKSKADTTATRLQITHVFDAPRAEVFEWWARADKLQQWSGCKEATRCEVVMDFRVGGSFTQTMQITVDGGTCEVSFIGVYEEIVVPERISYRTDLGKGITRVLVEFVDHGDQTTVILTQHGFTDSGACKIVSQGTLESFEKLDSKLGDHSVTKAALT